MKKRIGILGGMSYKYTYLFDTMDLHVEAALSKSATS